MKIIETTNEKGNTLVRIEFDIPIKFNLYEKKKPEEYAAVAQEKLRFMIRAVLENVSAVAYANQNFDVEIDADFLEFLGEVGFGMTEAVERIGLDCKGKRFTYESDC